jgi:thymidine phosphorylase
VTVAADAEGYVTAVDALEIGLTAVAMGAGRTRVDQSVDPAVGISVDAKPGTHVRRGDPLVRLHVRSPEDAQRYQSRVRAAFHMGPAAPVPLPLVRGRVEA